VGATRDGTLFEEQRRHLKYNLKSSFYAIPLDPRVAGGSCFRKSPVFSGDADFPSKMPYSDNLLTIRHLADPLLTNINTYI
jgi:hypothetical protein